MTVRSNTEYIGSKRMLLDFVVENVRRKVGAATEVADIFSGTGVVSAAFKARGFSVSANDHLATCFNLTSAVLLNDRPPGFFRLPKKARGALGAPYESVLDYLNKLPIRRGGFIHQNYSPAAIENGGVERMYFSEANAARIDTIREQIHRWESLLTREESALLLADLVKAVSSVSNVAGTYGCYLKRWKPRALEPLKLLPSSFISGGKSGHEVTSIDAAQSLRELSRAVVYADPPYTKRQYAAYYHVLETIVRNDRPELAGTTGLRNWKTHSSDFCYKRKAPSALAALLRSAQCDHFFLSYNDDGQISHDGILDILGSYGRTDFFEKKLRRYKSGQKSRLGPFVTERLYCVRMG